MYLVYVNPVGASGPDADTYHSLEVATEIFEQSCSPVLTIEAWLIYVGPNPLFAGCNIGRVPGKGTNGG